MNLDELRGLIDQINEEIVALFARRLEITQQIAKVKKEHKLAVNDPIREEKQRMLLRALAQKKGLNPAVVEEIFHLFVEYSKLTMQMEMGNEEDRLSGN
jgi:chorismate mutase